MSKVNPNPKLVIKINIKKPTKHLTSRNLLTIPLAAIETDSDGVRTPATRVTGLTEKVMIRSETMPTELIERQTPFTSKVAS